MSSATTTTTTQTASSAVPNAGTKVPKFAVKAGFVIPKNKLSGSLVPVIRGGKKPGKNDVIDEEGKVSKVQRKTKWGNDLTLDSAVRRGRALAYQTRVDQIVQQLESGSLEVEVNQDSEVASRNVDQKSSNPQVDREKLEHLELEMREAIGEILELNPNYNAPPDYKPLLKEAIVPIPVKEYRGYNFLGLIFGPASDTQKRLEKETGTIIKVYGTKADTGEKVEISTSDGNVQDAYEELYINILAETYDKVDAAADLIELLVTSVSGSLAAISTPTSAPGVNANVVSQSQGEGAPFIVPNAVVNSGVAQMVGPMQIPPQGQGQDQIPWFRSGPLQNSMHPMNSSAPILTNPINMPSLFGPRPGTAAEFPLILRTPSPVLPGSQPQMQTLPRPYMPQVHSGPPGNFPMPAPQPTSVQSNMVLLHSTGIQPQPMRPFAAGKPSMPSLPQSVSSIPPRPLSDRPLTPANAPASLGLSTMGQLIQGPRSVTSQSGIASPAPPNMSAANMVSPASFPARASSSAMNPPPCPVFPFSPPLVGSSHSFSASIHPTQVPGSVLTPGPSISRPTIQVGIAGSVSGSITDFSTINSSSATAPRPQHPSSGDFTFQPHRPQNLVSATVPRPSGMLNTPSPRPMVQLPAPQAPQPIMQAPRPHFGNQMGQPQVHTTAVPFAARNSNAAFANVSSVSPAAPSLPMGPRNLGPDPQMPYSAGPFPARPGNPLPQNYPAPTSRPQNYMGMNQQFSNNRARGLQIYDPFSPTSVSIPQQQQGGANPAGARKPENDPEYEDLMSSVGVK